MKRRRGDKVLPPVHPNAGIEADYRRRLLALIDDMQASYEYWITARYRAAAAIAQDAGIKKVTAWEAQIGGNKLGRVWFAYVDGEMLRGRNGVGRAFRSQQTAEEAGLRAAGAEGVLTKALPMGDPDYFKVSTPAELEPIVTRVSSLEDRLTSLGAQWQAEFDTVAPNLARWFAQSVGRRSQDRLQKILRDGGVSVRFQMTPAVRTVVEANIAENVGLIRSIASRYHDDVQGMVMRSVAAGRDVGGLTADLEERFRITRRRASRIALDQNNKATADVVRARQSELGLKATWLHSAGGKKPRKTHVANSGKPYDPAVGWFDPDPKVRKRIWPGQLIHCRCVSRTVVPGFS